MWTFYDMENKIMLNQNNEKMMKNRLSFKQVS